MPPFDESFVSVGGRLAHESDFAFYKNNGEIANRMRTDLSSSFNGMSIDNDGDINIETDQGSFIVTPIAILATGLATNLKTLLTPQESARFAEVFDLLAKSRGSFTTELYNIRLFFRFVPENKFGLLRERGFESALQLALGEKRPSDIQSLKFSTTYNKGEFLDFIELDASSKDVQLRYSRSGTGTDFKSYRAFLDAVNLPKLIEELKPFAEVLIAAEPPRRLPRPR